MGALSEAIPKRFAISRRASACTLFPPPENWYITSQAHPPYRRRNSTFSWRSCHLPVILQVTIRDARVYMSYLPCNTVMSVAGNGSGYDSHVPHGALEHSSTTARRNVEHSISHHSHCLRRLVSRESRHISTSLPREIELTPHMLF